MNIHVRHMLVGPISFLVIMYFSILFLVLTKMKYQKKFEWKFIPIYPFAWLFLLIDVLFNYTVGTFLFLELPKENLFTARLKRHKNNDKNHDYRDFAFYICGLLNRYDKGHC